MTLVIMAAGMGSRFGGLKQIEPVGENNEFIIDYCIYDAIKVGFTKVVFIIKEENYDIFRETIGKRIENKIKVEYVFQKNDNVPENITIPKDRVKPLGTGHAILCCKDVVKEPFAIMNADDFYGYDAFRVIGEFLRNNTNPREYAMAGYIVGNTLTENGAVKRGVCKYDGKYLQELIESSVEKTGEKIIATPINGDPSFEIEEDTLVSMNIFAFKPSFFELLENGFNEFLLNNKDDLETCEYYLSNVVFNAIKSNAATVEVLRTSAVWHGVTYKEDKESLQEAIRKMIENKEYPKNLWNN